MTKQYLAHKFRLKPTIEQAHVLESWCHINRFIWNHFLEVNQTRYQAEHKFTFYHEMATSLPKLKHIHSFLTEPPSQSLQGICRRLESAIKRVWQLHAGFPHFKSKRRGDLPSIQIPQSRTTIQWNKDHIKIPKLGWVKWAKHRPLSGKLVSTTTKYEGGHWWCVVLCEATPHAKRQDGDVVGIDLGLSDWVVTSDGEVFHLHPDLTRQEEQVVTCQRLSQDQV